MEPEIVALARRMRAAWVVQHVADLGEDDGSTFDSATRRHRRQWLAAAIVARPDLAEGVWVYSDHWAAGVLPALEPR